MRYSARYIEIHHAIEFGGWFGLACGESIYWILSLRVRSFPHVRFPFFSLIYARVTFLHIGIKDRRVRTANGKKSRIFSNNTNARNYTCYRCLKWRYSQSLATSLLYYFFFYRSFNYNVQRFYRSLPLLCSIPSFVLLIFCFTTHRIPYLCFS